MFSWFWLGVLSGGVDGGDCPVGLGLAGIKKRLSLQEVRTKPSQRFSLSKVQESLQEVRTKPSQRFSLSKVQESLQDGRSKSSQRFSISRVQESRQHVRSKPSQGSHEKGWSVRGNRRFPGLVPYLDKQHMRRNTNTRTIIPYCL